ncbi:MAG: hypothetical protein ABIQ86_08275 [Steroidobacteraceae bacterium]
MPLLHPPASRMLAVLLVAMGTGACAQSPTDIVANAAPAQTAGCLATGDGSLQAELRGALEADLVWQDAQMQCEGGPRPDGEGIRVTIAGPLPAPATPSQSPGAGNAPAHLRFIFGIDLRDTASGVAQALPTNLTVIVEGGQQLYATRGDDKCAVETLQRTPLQASGGKLDRVKVRGYCIGPASDLAGKMRLLVPTFSFTALIRNGDDP